MSNDRAAEAREGLFDNVAGKAKEVAGAVSGRDDLVEEGQLQQAEARNRKDAVADEAVAAAKQQEAAQEIRETSREAAEQKTAAHAEAAQEESVVARQREAEHANAARDAERQEAAGREAAEQRADALAASRQREAQAIAADASSTEQQAATEQLRLEQEAVDAEQQAARLRAQTEKGGPPPRSAPSSPFPTSWPGSRSSSSTTDCPTGCRRRRAHVSRSTAPSDRSTSSPGPCYTTATSAGAAPTASSPPRSP